LYAKNRGTEDQEFFVGQKAFIDKNGEILVLIDEFGLDLPGGKIQKGEEDFSTSLKREVREETGLEIEVGTLFQSWQWKMRRGPNIGKLIFLVGYKCKYLSGELKLSEEHNNFRWVNKNNYQELGDDGEYFKAIEKYFEGG